ncbi:S-layer homology domain-containing protein [Thermophilibacter mediterraneus]|uniref:S-layer homology domain-containing protein n=1 Tax=Thermophilibacter mediterraneus TaxID=1871031 RepID=UPI000931762D|nr:S-layer homology domain-containing protein [Thermophilibacter mediterraneus]
MTACTNNGGSRARRAVTAALVGVLSVGAAPMVALATGAAPASGDVQVMATSDNAFREGTVQYSNGESGQSFVYNQRFQGLEPESFTDFGATKPQEETFNYNTSFSGLTAGDYYYAYAIVDQSAGNNEPSDSDGNKIEYINEDGKRVTLRIKGYVASDATPVEPGTYAVVVYKATSASTFVCRSIADTFTVVNGGLEGATLVDDGDVNDSTFEFTGENGSAQAKNVFDRLGVALDGVELEKGTDYTVDSFHEKGKNVELSGKNDLLEVGKTYVLDITGKGNDFGVNGVKASFEFTFGQLNLDNVSVVSVGAKVGSAPETGDVKNVVKELNGVDKDDLNSSRFSVSVSGPDANGVYTYTISQSDSDKKGDNLVTGAATVQVAVGQKPASFLYSGASITAGGQWGGTAGDYTYTYDMTDASQKPFDITKLTATTGSKDVTFTYTVQNAKTGASASVENLDDRGEWIVTAVANDKVDGQRWVDAVSITVTNNNVLSDDANVFVSYDGELVPSGTPIKDTYTGEDLLGKLSVTVKAGDETLVEGEDYTVEVSTKDQTGKTVVVDKVVDHGNYTVTIKGKSFSLDTNTYDFVVDKRTLTKLAPSDAFASEVVYDGSAYRNVYYYAYTGEEIVPEYTFYDADGNEWTLAADEYEVSYQSGGKDATLKGEGEYTFKGGSVNVKASSTNFKGSSLSTVQPSGYRSTAPSKIVVTTASSFVDVPNDAWYAEAVATAKQQNYIVGLNGSNFFAPMNSMTRADVVCVLYRMAGGTVVNEGLSEEESSYVSGFSDVDQHAYYAKAVAWATRAGIVRGYGDTFGTERDVSTEEFATMLARYAAKMGDDTSVDTDAVLAGVADGDKVSSYARDAVAWAVENGYVASNGNLIDPQGSVYRARVVTIAVRYQPEQLHVIL